MELPINCRVKPTSSQKHVGHEVAITGKPAIRSVGTTIQGQGSSVKEEPVFKVSDVQHVADACTSAGH